jgi:hypothetical protein
MASAVISGRRPLLAVHAVRRDGADQQHCGSPSSDAATFPDGYLCGTCFAAALDTPVRSQSAALPGRCPRRPSGTHLLRLHRQQPLLQCLRCYPVSLKLVSDGLADLGGTRFSETDEGWQRALR